MHIKVEVEFNLPTQEITEIIKALSVGDNSPLKNVVEQLASETLRSATGGSSSPESEKKGVDLSGVFDSFTRNLGESFGGSAGESSVPKIIDSLVGSFRPDLQGKVAPQAEALGELFQGLSGMMREMMSVKKEESGDIDVVLATYEGDETDEHPEVKMVELTEIEVEEIPAKVVEK
jgi:hypothetical protein